MNNGEALDVALVAYVIAFGGYLYARHDTIKIRRELYPGKPNFVQAERNFWRLTASFTIGLLWLLFGAFNRLEPMPTLVVLALLMMTCYFAIHPKLTLLLKRRKVRFWVAGTIVWAASIATWATIAGRDIHNVVALVALPPIVAALALALYSWARSGEM